MQFPERFSDLPDYAFPRLRKLLDAHAPGGEPIVMTIGEPQHAFPDWVGAVLAKHIEEFGKYPPNEGTPALLDAICGWVKRRYGIEIQPENLIALNGTREGLYNAAMALCPEAKHGQRPVILMPNPFYQVYAVAALAVGAEPVYLTTSAETGHLPVFSEVPAGILNRTSIVYICSPANPQGAVASADYWRDLITLAEKHDFRIFADECYSEIWRDRAPVGALQIAAEMGADPERVMVFHSLSKRSNLPGLRSGFAAGGPKSIAAMRTLRNYAGAPLPLPLQRVAEKVWADETHVTESRAIYQQKYRIADTVLADVPGYAPPPAGFFLWLPVPDGEQAALSLWQQTGVRVLPGSYLGRGKGPDNPGHGFIRVAMVAPTQDMQRALTMLCDCLYK